MLTDWQREKWAYDLRNGVYEQTDGVLRADGNQRCCLGVYGDVVCVSWTNRESHEDLSNEWSVGGLKGLLPEEVMDTNVQDCFTNMNDRVKLTFSQIADFVDYGAVPRPGGYDFDQGFGKRVPTRDDEMDWLSL